MGSQSNSDAAPATVDELKTIQDVTVSCSLNDMGRRMVSKKHTHEPGDRPKASKIIILRAAE